MIWHRSKAVIVTANQLPSPILQCIVGCRDTHLVLIILMQIQAALLRLPPSLGHGFIDVGLVDDLGYELRPVVNAGRIRGRDLCAVNGVGGAIFEEKGEESEDGTDEEDDYEGIDY